jgi:hypothetical protein
MAKKPKQDGEKQGAKKQDAKKQRAPDGICVAGHPRSAGLVQREVCREREADETAPALRAPHEAGLVRRAKGWGGLVGLALATYLALHANVPPLDAMVRGLAGGVVGYIVLWALAVAVARQLVIAEVRVRYAEVQQAAAAAAAAAPDAS